MTSNEDLSTPAGVSPPGDIYLRQKKVLHEDLMPVWSLNGTDPGPMFSQVAANLITDDVLMRSYQLTPEYRPLVDLHGDLAPTQGNKGWFFGYSDALVGSTASFKPFKYEAHGNGQLQDGRWMVREVM